MSALIFSLTVLLGVTPATIPDPPAPYAWVCDYLDAAPTVFGVWGIPGEAQDRGLTPDPVAITATVDQDCPQYSALVDSGLGLVIGG